MQYILPQKFTLSSPRAESARAVTGPSPSAPTVGGGKMAGTIPPSFVEIGPKLRVVALLTRQWPKTAKSRGEPQKMTPSSETENFLGVVPMGKLEPRV